MLLDKEFLEVAAENGKLRARIAELEAAIDKIVLAFNRAKMKIRPGPCGMTIDAQIRHSYYNGVDAWAVEELIEARSALEKKND